MTPSDKIGGGESEVFWYGGPASWVAATASVLIHGAMAAVALVDWGSDPVPMPSQTIELAVVFEAALPGGAAEGAAARQEEPPGSAAPTPIGRPRGGIEANPSVQSPEPKLLDAANEEDLPPAAQTAAEELAAVEDWPIDLLPASAEGDAPDEKQESRPARALPQAEPIAIPPPVEAAAPSLDGGPAVVPPATSDPVVQAQPRDTPVEMAPAPEAAVLARAAPPPKPKPPAVDDSLVAAPAQPAAAPPVKEAATRDAAPSTPTSAPREMTDAGSTPPSDAGMPSDELAALPPVSPEPTPSDARAGTGAVSQGPHFRVGSAANPLPRYPRVARRQGIEGRVVLRVRVTTDGRPAAVAVLKGSGSELLDRVASQTVHRWRFQPALRVGIPVAGTVDVPISFRLLN